MPLVRISLLRGKSPAYHAALSDGVYRAMRETFNVPEGDRFILIHEHEPGTFFVDPDYLGIPRSADAVIIQITCNDTRTTAQKIAFYARIAEHLGRSPGVRQEDVFINLVEVKAENWSFGRGIAQYAKPPQ
jgi:phenylpyruvate tautomerase PptA (4-oxalocrotonate tautomerase family)